MRSDGNCRSCNAPIRWAIFDGGKRVPLDAEANPDGNLGVIRWGPRSGSAFALPVVAVNPTGPTETPFRYTSHFATCPQADEWRKPQSTTQ
jgi:hypothetical protein